MSEQITTPEELDALPVGSVVRGDDGHPWEKARDVNGGGRPWRTGLTFGRFEARAAGLLPAAVLYRPDVPAPTSPVEVIAQAAVGRVREFIESWEGQAHAPERIAFTAADPEGHDGAVLTLTDLRRALAARSPQPVPSVSAEQVFQARVSVNRTDDEGYLSPDNVVAFLDALGIEVTP